MRKVATRVSLMLLKITGSAVLACIGCGLALLSLIALNFTFPEVELTRQIVTHCLAVVTCVGIAVASFLLATFFGEEEGDMLREAIPSDHGNDLSTVMEAIRYEPLEYLAFFDVNGTKLAEGTLNSNSACDIPWDTRDIVYEQAYTSVHNHPGIDQMAFSESDIWCLLDDRAERSIIVTPDYTYVLRNPRWNCDNSPDPDIAQDYAAWVFGEYQGHYNPYIVFVMIAPRLYSWFVSWLVARRFGLEFHVIRHRAESSADARHAYAKPRFRLSRRNQ